MEHDGQIAVVTGGGRGIGKAVALAIAAEGANVAILDLKGGDKTANEVRALGRDAFAPITDVSDPASVLTSVAEVTEALGVPTIIVNCAGVIIRKSALDYTDEDFDRTIRVNLYGTWYVTHHYCRRMVASRKPGVVVTVASATALQASYGRAPYIASKAGVVGLTKALSLDLAQYEIRVNCVVPGATRTEMWSDFPKDAQGEQQTLFLTPLRRWAEPEDIAAAVSFLASERARHITGSLLVVDGGMSAGNPGGIGRWPAIRSIRERLRGGSRR